MTLCLIGIKFLRKALVSVHSWGLSAVGHLYGGAGQKPADLFVGPILVSIDGSSERNP